MRVIVCGGREYQDVVTLWRALDAFERKHRISAIIEGASDDVTGSYCGADYWARMWAAAHDKTTISVHAEWAKYGRAAGPIRNKRMRDEYEASALIAFPGGRGTANMINLADKIGMPIWLPHPTGIVLRAGAAA